jgi:hypothetical protein
LKKPLNIQCSTCFVLFIGYTEEKLMQLKEEEENKLLSDVKNEMSADDDMDLDKKNDQGATFVRNSDA